MNKGVTQPNMQDDDSDVEIVMERIHGKPEPLAKNKILGQHGTATVARGESFAIKEEPVQIHAEYEPLDLTRKNSEQGVARSLLKKGNYLDVEAEMEQLYGVYEPLVTRNIGQLGNTTTKIKECVLDIEAGKQRILIESPQSVVEELKKVQRVLQEEWKEHKQILLEERKEHQQILQKEHEKLQQILEHERKELRQTFEKYKRQVLEEPTNSKQILEEQQMDLPQVLEEHPQLVIADDPQHVLDDGSEELPRSLEDSKNVHVTLEENPLHAIKEEPMEIEQVSEEDPRGLENELKKLRLKRKERQSIFEEDSSQVLERRQRTMEPQQTHNDSDYLQWVCDERYEKLRLALEQQNKDVQLMRDKGQEGVREILERKFKNLKWPIKPIERPVKSPKIYIETPKDSEDLQLEYDVRYQNLCWALEQQRRDVQLMRDKGQEGVREILERKFKNLKWPINQKSLEIPKNFQRAPEGHLGDLQRVLKKDPEDLPQVLGDPKNLRGVIKEEPEDL